MTSASRDRRPLIVFAHAGADWIRGSEQCLLDLLAGLDRERFRMLMLCNSPVLACEVERCGTEVVRIRRWPRTPVGALSERGPILELLRSRGAALVHANADRTLPVMYQVAHRLSAPMVSHLHVPFFTYREFHRYLVEHSAAAVGVAQNVVAPLRASRMPPDRIRIIYNAVNARRLAEGDVRGLRAELGIPPTAIVAASIASLILRKGHDVTVRALAKAHARGLEVHLLLCGAGSEETALRTLADALGVGPRVHLLGYRADPGAVLRDASDLLVASAREEAFGLNVIEAQWLGVPVIASDVPGHREALSTSAGMFVPPDEPDALAAALTALAGAPGRRAAMADAGRAFARDRFGTGAYVQAFESLYDELLERAAGGGVADVGGPPIFGAWLRTELSRRARKLVDRWQGTRRDWIRE